MRHELTRHCITLGSALAIGFAAASGMTLAEDVSAPPKQKALISFDGNVLSRWKKDDASVEPAKALPAESAEGEQKALLPPNSIFARQVPAATSPAATTPLPPTSLVVGPENAAPTMTAQPIATMLPSGAVAAQLTAGQMPAATGTMPFATAQSPVVIMMPAGWQPDGSYTFAPRSVLSPEVPAEHWPSTQRNPLGDDSKRGLFNWPQIAKKITTETIGEPELMKRPAPAPQPTSKALFAKSEPAPASETAAQSVSTDEGQTVAETAPTTSKALFASAPQPAAAAPPAAEAGSKALFAPQPAEPKDEGPKSRALFALLAKPMAKPGTTSAKSPSKALFAFGREKADGMGAPAPAVVPQYAAETSPASQQEVQRISPIEQVEMLDPEFRPPAPPSVSNPLPRSPQTGPLHTVKSDDPKMKWRSKGAPQESAMTPDGESTADTETARVETVESTSPAPQQTALTTSGMETFTSDTMMPEPTIPPRATGEGGGAAHRHTRQQVAVSVPVAPEAVSHERSLLGKWFPTASTQTPRNASDNRSPWRRQADRNAAAAVEKQGALEVANSKALFPNVAALLPQPEAASHPTPRHVPSEVTTVAATEDVDAKPHRVRRAHAASARSTDPYYAAPWEKEVEAELAALERRQIGTTSSRRAAIAHKTLEQDDDRGAQPRVPFEADELAQEKSLVRRAKAQQQAPVPPAPDRAHVATRDEQPAKPYRRLTGSDVKQGFIRPLAILGEMTKLPSPLKNAADNIEPRKHDPKQVYSSGDEAAQYKFYDEPRPRAYELRQSSAAAASVSKLDRNAMLAGDEDDDDTSATRNVRGGRRQVERTSRAQRAAHDVESHDDRAAEYEISDDESPVRRATHIRNKHGNKVLIYSDAESRAAE